MKKAIRIILLLAAGVAVLLVGFICGSASRIKIGKDPRVLQGHIVEMNKHNVCRWQQDATDTALVARPLPPDFRHHELFVERGNWTPYRVPLATNETCNNVVIASETNKAFALIETWEMVASTGAIGSDFSRVIELTLPEENRRLETMRIADVGLARKLHAHESCAFISSLDRISPDGRYLLMTRGVQLKTGEVKYRGEVFDMMSKSFLELTFDKGSP